MGARAHARARTQQVPDKVLGLIGHGLPLGPRERVLAAPHRLQHLPVAAALEGRRARQQHVRDDAQRPAVARGRVAPVARLGLVQHLGRDVVGRPHHRVHAPQRRAVLGAQPKVDELDVGRLVLGLEDEVLELQVAVRDAHEVAVADRGAHLEHEPRALGLRVAVAALLVQPVEQLAAVAVLQDEVDVVGVLVVLVQLDHVGVVQHLEQLDLVAQVVDELHVDAAHLHALERVLLARAAVLHLVHLARHAVADLLGDLVVVPHARVLALVHQVLPARAEGGGGGRGRGRDNRTARGCDERWRRRRRRRRLHRPGPRLTSARGARSRAGGSWRRAPPCPP